MLAGRYEVRGFLGEGAKKRVYLAHDTHWTPRGAKLAAETVAARLNKLALAPPPSREFRLEPVLVKRWGGVMSISVPEGQHHLGVTWKDDNLWIENFDPGSNTCEFREYSRGDVLQGRVIIKNCNPL